MLTPDTQVSFVLGNSDDPKVVLDHLASTHFLFGVLGCFLLRVDFHSVAHLQSCMVLTEDQNFPAMIFLSS